MSLGFYNDKGSLYVALRKQKNGRAIKFKYFPGIVLDDHVKGWDHKKKWPKEPHADKELTKLKGIVQNILDEHDAFSLTNESFANLIRERLHKKVAETSFFDYCAIFYEENKRKFGPRRAKSIQTAINKIKAFNPTLTFEQIDRRFYRELIGELEDQNNSANYIGSIIKDLKRILNYATENEANTNLAYKSFRKPAEEVYNVYLSESEIERIHRLDINSKLLMKMHKEDEEETGRKKAHLSDESIKRQIEGLDRARKLFVIGCWTGLRVENYLSIDPDMHIDLKTGFLHAIANKNGPKLKIPLHKFVREIISNEGFPKSVSQKILNEQIKILGRLAGIDEMVIYTRTLGGQRKQFVKKKYEMITSHTARRSFASNLTLSGIPKQYIMSITGHKKEQSFNKYIGAVKQDMLSEKLKGYDIWG